MAKRSSLRTRLIATTSMAVLALGALSGVGANAAAKSVYVNCAGLPAGVAAYGYQNVPANLLYVSAAGSSQTRINANSLTVVNRGAKAGYASASSASLNSAKTTGYCYPL